MKILRVSLVDAGPTDDTLRLFDDAQEALYWAILRDFQGIAEFPDLDSSARQFHVHASATRYLGTVTTLIRKKLKHYRVVGPAVIERL